MNTNILANGQQTQPATTIKLLGEVISWQLARGMLTTRQDIINALTSAGLDAKAARSLCYRHAFVRAVRELASGKLVRNLKDTADQITFQLTREQINDKSTNVLNFDAVITCDKLTGNITCPDAGLQQIVAAELAKSTEARRTADVSRIIVTLFEKNADLFSIHRGSYFVPERCFPFLARIDAFLTALGGKLTRFPIAAGTDRGDQSAAAAVTDGLDEAVNEIDTAVHGVDDSTRESTLEKLSKKLASIQEKIDIYESFVGPRKCILEDHLAYVRKLLADKTAEKEAAKELGTKSEPYKGLVDDGSDEEETVAAGTGTWGFTF